MLHWKLLMSMGWRLGIACFFLAFCSLSYEFVLAQMMSILGGHTVFFYCATIGLYVFSLGIGAVVPVANRDDTDVRRRLLEVEILLAILGGGAPFWMVAIDRLASTWGWTLFLSPQLAALPFAFLVVAIGFLSGMELPLLLRLGELHGDQRRVMLILVFDYVASFAGAVSFPLFLYPSLGIVRAAAIFAALNVLAALLLLPQKMRVWHWAMLTAVLSAAVLIVVRGEIASAWLSRMMIAS